MKRIYTYTGLVLLGAVMSLSIYNASAVNENTGNTKKDKSASWEESAKPGVGHKVLEKLEGKWDYTLKWWNSSDEAPMTASGTSDKKWIVGDRFLIMEHTGEWYGEEYEGVGIKGYDNSKNEFNTVWIDSLGTGMATTRGSYDPETKKLIEHGTATEAGSGGSVAYRGVTTFVDDNTYLYEYYMNDESGNEVRKMKMTYNRIR